MVLWGFLCWPWKLVILVKIFENKENTTNTQSNKETERNSKLTAMPQKGDFFRDVASKPERFISCVSHVTSEFHHSWAKAKINCMLSITYRASKHEVWDGAELRLQSRRGVLILKRFWLSATSSVSRHRSNLRGGVNSGHVSIYS